MKKEKQNKQVKKELWGLLGEGIPDKRCVFPRQCPDSMLRSHVSLVPRPTPHAPNHERNTCLKRKCIHGAEGA